MLAGDQLARLPHQFLEEPGVAARKPDLSVSVSLQMKHLHQTRYHQTQPTVPQGEVKCADTATADRKSPSLWKRRLGFLVKKPQVKVLEHICGAGRGYAGGASVETALLACCCVCECVWVCVCIPSKQLVWSVYR